MWLLETGGVDCPNWKPPGGFVPAVLLRAQQDERTVSTDDRIDPPPPLLPRVARGDSVAIRECIQRYGPLLLSLVRRWLNRDDDTDDALQDIFIELWKAAKSYDPLATPEVGFVTMIARRKLIDRYRRQKSRPKSETLLESVAEQEQRPHWDVLDELQPVNAALQKLPAEQRRVLLLAVCDGWTQQEIADQTGLPLGTVKTYVRRSLMVVRELCTQGGLA